MSGSGLKPATRPDPARLDPEKPSPGGRLWRTQGSASSYGKPEPWSVLHEDVKSPAKSPSPAQPKPDPEAGLGGLRARAHTLSRPDPPKPGLSPKNPTRPDPTWTSLRVTHQKLFAALSVKKKAQISFDPNSTETQTMRSFRGWVTSATEKAAFSNAYPMESVNHHQLRKCQSSLKSINGSVPDADSHTTATCASHA
ncbi:uncharacterized protein EV420DRAFT_1484355 [Desarmillaria tabescens]|uniref:Uncharacterized protein n=1 Tax=Armillaria tabescens TaxID=1929756 RepID=A0AA39JN24_ARMTA|nr:uncharacterized protein EV420DRAFT_1484355 [Desarmillaria tabescens]KAK0445302.1 hypothetical protein EV420DRAFT_1484355 [Desarmillaria tabescens]